MLPCTTTYMRRRGKVIDGAGHDATLNHPPPSSLAQPDTVWACEVTCSQLSFPPPILTGTGRTHAAASLLDVPWVGPPTSGKGLGWAVGLFGRRLLLRYTTVPTYDHHHFRSLGVV